ncbi:MAG: argininosuccinate lyase [Planctomycetota bacterium]
MTLWDRDAPVDAAILAFSAGNEHQLDQRLVPYDCAASIAHARMLGAIGVLAEEEVARLQAGLEEIRRLHGEGKFPIAPAQEDCHTAIEEWLTHEVGEAGKKIHLGRSRNDQVLTAVRLYEKDALAELGRRLARLAAALAARIARDGAIPMPGYTHMQRAMPTTAGTWLGAFAAAVRDDEELLRAVAALVDRSPLGTGAGFGIPVFALDRALTARELGFAGVLENPIYAQMSRGKLEGSVLHLLSTVMLTLNRLASDLLLFSTAEFGFVSLPEAFCTGSSIMPQKRNPDVLELVRARYHVVAAAEGEVRGLAGNLSSGYQRDLGLTKEPLFRAFDATLASADMMARVVDGFLLHAEACRRAMTRELHATAEAYALVKEGVPFRDAYRRVAARYRRDAGE